MGIVYLGLLLIGAGGLAVMRAYISSVGERESEYREMHELLLHIKREMRSFLKTPGEICQSFGGTLLDERGVLDGFALHNTEKMFDGSLLKKEDKDMLIPFFERFGTGLYESEMEALTDICARFGERVEKVCFESERSKRLTPVICVFVFISLVLMLM